MALDKVMGAGKGKIEEEEALRKYRRELNKVRMYFLKERWARERKIIEEERRKRELTYTPSKNPDIYKGQPF